MWKPGPIAVVIPQLALLGFAGDAETRHSTSADPDVRCCTSRSECTTAATLDACIEDLSAMHPDFESPALEKDMMPSPRHARPSSCGSKPTSDVQPILILDCSQTEGRCTTCRYEQCGRRERASVQGTETDVQDTEAEEIFMFCPSDDGMEVRFEGEYLARVADGMLQYAKRSEGACR